MVAVIQRVREAKVTVQNTTISYIQTGLLTFIGFEMGDQIHSLKPLISKIIHLRIFEDTQGKMNLSLKDIKGEHLLVPQFTLASDLSSGLRPSFGLALPPQEAKSMYEQALMISSELGIETKSGQFGADMNISLTNQGPATFIIRSDPIINRRSKSPRCEADD